MVEVKKIIDFQNLKTETILVNPHNIQYLRKIKNGDNEIYELNINNTTTIYIKGFPINRSLNTK